MMSRKYHLQDDLGISKKTLRYVIERNAGSDTITDEMVALVNRSGNFYTLEELDEIRGLFCDSHDEHCGRDCDECSNLDIHNNSRRFDRAWKAWEFIDNEISSLGVDGQ